MSLVALASVRCMHACRRRAEEKVRTAGEGMEGLEICRVDFVAGNVAEKTGCKTLGTKQEKIMQTCASS